MSLLYISKSVLIFCCYIYKLQNKSFRTCIALGLSWLIYKACGHSASISFEKSEIDEIAIDNSDLRCFYEG